MNLVEDKKEQLIPLSERIQVQPQIYGLNQSIRLDSPNLAFSQKSNFQYGNQGIVQEHKISVCGLDNATIRKAINIRQFYKSGDPYVCKVCHMQLSSSEHVVETDSTFIKFELMFNMSCESGPDSTEVPAYYQLKCEGCHSVIGAKPATMSSKAVIQSLDSAAEESQGDDHYHSASKGRLNQV